MSKQHDIMNTVTANGMREWTNERVGQAMREYATAVAEDALKRAAESLDREIIEGVIYVDKQSILSTPINTDL